MRLQVIQSTGIRSRCARGVAAVFSLCLLAWWPAVLPVASAAAGADTGKLTELAGESRLTVRALRAFGEMPGAIDPLVLVFRALNRDLLSADSAQIKTWLADIDSGALGLPSPEVETLREIAARMEQLQVPSTERGTGSAAPASGVAGPPRSAAEQQALAEALMERVAALDMWEVDAIEALYLRLIDEAPDTREVEASYWYLSNLYMRGFEPPRNAEAIALLERYAVRHPASTLFDDRFPQFGTPGLPLSRTRLLFLYEREERWDEAAALYDELIPDPGGVTLPPVLDLLIGYGRVMERVGRVDDARVAYESFLERRGSPGPILERVARLRLEELGQNPSPPGTAPAEQSAAAAVSDREPGTPANRIAPDLPAGSVAGTAAPPDRSDDSGASPFPLHAAALRGDSALIRHLAGQGADVNAIDDAGETTLHPAVAESHVEVVETLLALGADVDARSRWGDTALHLAVENDDLAMIVLLLGNGAGPDIGDEIGQTPIYRTRSDEVMELLLDHGASVRVTDVNGVAPLHIAASMRNPRLVAAMLRRGADAWVRDANGRAPFDLVADQIAWPEGLEIAEDLVVQGTSADAATTGWPELRLAAIRGDPERVAANIDRDGMDAIDDDSFRQWSALHAAARAGRTEVIELLIERGADPDHRAQQQGSALAFAALGGHRDTVAVLLHAGADPAHLRDAMRRAIWSRDRTGIARLVAAGVDLNEPDADGRTVLAELDEEIVLLDHLIVLGADINQPVARGISLLHGAASAGSHEWMSALLARGADANATEADTGWTPLHHAAREGHLAAVELLVRHGADPDIEDAFGETALTWARKQGRGDVAGFLSDLPGGDSR